MAEGEDTLSTESASPQAPMTAQEYVETRGAKLPCLSKYRLARRLRSTL